MKSDMAKRVDKARLQDVKFCETPDIVVKVICRYRAELFFKISRKTKLSRLLNAWADRMEVLMSGSGAKKIESGESADGSEHLNASVKSDVVSTQGSTSSSHFVQFVFTHNGRNVEAEQTPGEAGIEDGDEILAVELMDLTEDPRADEIVRLGSVVLPTANLVRKAGPAGRTMSAEAEEELD
jgi:hypothetical protein